METGRRFDERPVLVVWELSRAWTHRSGGVLDEVTTEEGHRLLRRLTGFGDPLPRLFLTDGDPFPPCDCAALTAAASKLGFRVAVAARSKTPVTTEWLRALKGAELARLVVGLDSAALEVHDALRGDRGSFDRTMRVLETGRALDIPIQIDSRVTRRTLAGLPALASLVAELGAMLWQLAFPVSPGRLGAEDSITAFECESTLNDVHDLSLTAPFRIETAEAPHYRRVILERRRGVRRDGGTAWPVTSRWPVHLDPLRHAAVEDGKGLLFIDRRGRVYPSPSLRVAAGSIRRASPVTIYRTHPLFRALRDPDRLQGRCGRCLFRGTCGGSRARAFAVTGDPLGEEPLCLYTPCADPMEAPTTS